MQHIYFDIPHTVNVEEERNKIARTMKEYDHRLLEERLLEKLDTLKIKMYF